MRTRTAAEFMSQAVVTAREDLRVTEAIRLMLAHKVSCLPVVEPAAEAGQPGPRLLGLITEYDVMNLALSGEADRTAVGEVMARQVVTLAPTDGLWQVVDTCVTRRIHRAPVVQDGCLVGIVSRRDLLGEIVREEQR